MKARLRIATVTVPAPGRLGRVSPGRCRPALTLGNVRCGGVMRGMTRLMACYLAGRLLHECREIGSDRHGCREITSVRHGCREITSVRHGCREITSVRHGCRRIALVPGHGSRSTARCAPRMQRICPGTSTDAGKRHHPKGLGPGPLHGCSQMDALGQHGCRETVRGKHRCREMSRMQWSSTASVPFACMCGLGAPVFLHPSLGVGRFPACVSRGLRFPCMREPGAAVSLHAWAGGCGFPACVARGLRLPCIRPPGLQFFCVRGLGAPVSLHAWSGGSGFPASLDCDLRPAPGPMLGARCLMAVVSPTGD